MKPILQWHCESYSVKASVLTGTSSNSIDCKLQPMATVITIFNGNFILNFLLQLGSYCNRSNLNDLWRLSARDPCRVFDV